VDGGAGTPGHEPAEGGTEALGREATDAVIASRTDAYFNRTRAIVRRFGDARVTYAVFLRRPVVSAPRLMLDWLEEVARARGTQFDIELMHPEGTWVGAGDPILTLSGSFA
jgi:nicotinate phosphoribosyltransferase